MIMVIMMKYKILIGLSFSEYIKIIGGLQLAIFTYRVPGYKLNDGIQDVFAEDINLGGHYFGFHPSSIHEMETNFWFPSNNSELFSSLVYRRRTFRPDNTIWCKSAPTMH